MKTFFICLGLLGLVFLFALQRVFSKRSQKINNDTEKNPAPLPWKQQFIEIWSPAPTEAKKFSPSEPPLYSQADPNYDQYYDATGKYNYQE